MSQGFLLANIDVGMLTDPKFLKLARVVPDEGERASTILVYVQTVFQSWHDGQRLTVEEAEGLWEPTAERIEALMAAKLIDAECRIPSSAWEKYYVPALERSQRRRASGRQGGLASGRKRKRRSSDASAPPQTRRRDGEAPLDLTPADTPSPEGEGGVGRAGLRVMDAPARPPGMDHLDEMDIHAIEAMLRELPTNDGRRRRLKDELVARQATSDRLGATPEGSTDAGHEALASDEVHTQGPAVSALKANESGPYPGLTYGPEDRPAFDPTSKRRYDRRRSNPDAAGSFDLEELGPAGPSPTSRALSR